MTVHRVLPRRTTVEPSAADAPSRGRSTDLNPTTLSPPCAPQDGCEPSDPGPMKTMTDSAYCNGCERTIRLKKDRTFQRHTVRTLGLLCPGSGLTPTDANSRNLWERAK